MAAIPIVIGAVYFGGWWLFALIMVAALIGLHEFWLMAKPLAPLAPAGYVGAVLALVGAERGGIEWMVAGMLTALPLAFLLKGVSATRQAPTASISATVMGTVWVGCGLAFVLLLRDLPEHGRLAALTVVLAVWAGDTLAYLGGRVFGRHRMAPTTSPGKTWEGFAFGTAATIFVAFVALYKQHFLTIAESLAFGGVLAVAAPPATCSSRCSSATQASRTPARSWAATAACSTASTRSCSPCLRRTSRLPRSACGELELLESPSLQRYAEGHETDRPARRDRLDRAPGDRGDRRAPRARARGRHVGVAADRRARAADADRRRPRPSSSSKPSPDIVLNAVVGFAGLVPTMWTLENGVTLALANKESLVAAGDLALARPRAGEGRPDPGRQRALRDLPVRAPRRA